MLIERWRRPSMLSSMRQHVTRLQFDSSSEKDSLCGTVMIHDGLNLRCLDQCHCVRSRGKSSSQSWRKRSVLRQSDLANSGQHPCFGPNRFIQFCHNGDKYGVPRIVISNLVNQWESRRVSFPFSCHSFAILESHSEIIGIHFCHS